MKDKKHLTLVSLMFILGACATNDLGSSSQIISERVVLNSQKENSAKLILSLNFDNKGFVIKSNNDLMDSIDSIEFALRDYLGQEHFRKLNLADPKTEFENLAVGKANLEASIRYKNGNIEKKYFDIDLKPGNNQMELLLELDGDQEESKANLSVIATIRKTKPITEPTLPIESENPSPDFDFTPEPEESSFIPEFPIETTIPSSDSSFTPKATESNPPVQLILSDYSWDFTERRLPDEVDGKNQQINVTFRGHFNKDCKVIIENLTNGNFASINYTKEFKLNLPLNIDKNILKIKAELNEKTIFSETKELVIPTRNNIIEGNSYFNNTEYSNTILESLLKTNIDNKSFDLFVKKSDNSLFISSGRIVVDINGEIRQGFYKKHDKEILFSMPTSSFKRNNSNKIINVVLYPDNLKEGQFMRASAPNRPLSFVY